MFDECADTRDHIFPRQLVLDDNHMTPERMVSALKDVCSEMKFSRYCACLVLIEGTFLHVAVLLKKKDGGFTMYDANGFSCLELDFLSEDVNILEAAGVSVVPGTGILQTLRDGFCVYCSTYVAIRYAKGDHDVLRRISSPSHHATEAARIVEMYYGSLRKHKYI
jgi:hypothetical protein